MEGNQEKVKLAARLRRETTLSLKWIAQRLPMGSWTCVSNLLKEESRRRCVNREDTCPLPDAISVGRKGQEKVQIPA
jgi:hypothetical protein